MLQRLLGSSPLSVGIHKKALANLIQALADKEPHNRLCLLLFDEMAIRQHFNCKVASDTITGFEDHGILGGSKTPAKYVLVFMVWGLLQDWKQPVAAFFSGSPTNPERLKELLELVLRECSVRLKELLELVLRECSEAGLQIISTVCDMGSNNVKALKLMGSTVESPVINLAGQELITTYDPLHLLKSTRNLFLKHDGGSKLSQNCCTIFESSSLQLSDDRIFSWSVHLKFTCNNISVRKLVDSWEFLEDSSSYPEVPDIDRPSM
ncbi:hypothetical protein J437_LFUL014029 [Ladona fulva]|uniref:Transposable element P transposase-like RNase H domain-containing protein n=1 Tax=Ladona fulva TaxID=123851 RepID=A0A8K0P4K7_LADFU|nr:hypothetical protein J437_LFUL014029 [Ladona fulva]